MSDHLDVLDAFFTHRRQQTGSYVVSTKLPLAWFTTSQLFRFGFTSPVFADSGRTDSNSTGT